MLSRVYSAKLVGKSSSSSCTKKFSCAAIHFGEGPNVLGLAIVSDLVGFIVQYDIEGQVLG